MLFFSVCNQDSIETHPSLFSQPLRCRSRERATNERRWNHALGTRKGATRVLQWPWKESWIPTEWNSARTWWRQLEKVQLAERIRFLVRRLPPLDGGKSPLSLFPSIELSSVGSPLALWFSPSYCQWVYSMCLYSLPSRGFSTGLLYCRGPVFMAALQTALQTVL